MNDLNEDGVKETAEQIGVLTRQRDDRIDRCVKYDLGGGYRLVTCREDERVFVLYIGTHDECHRWMENNKGWRPESLIKRGLSIPVVMPLIESSEGQFEETCVWEQEDYLPEIDEKILRMIFKPLLDG